MRQAAKGYNKKFIFASLRLCEQTKIYLMNENELSRIIVNMIFNIHKTLGPGLFESVYEEILCYELTKRGLNFTRQQPIPVTWD